MHHSDPQVEPTREHAVSAVECFFAPRHIEGLARTADAPSNVRSSYHLIRLFVGVIFLAAALLKAYEIAQPDAAYGGGLSRRWATILVVEFELAISIWLFADVYRRATRWVAVICFGVFACASLARAMQGYASCGCFGAVRVNPWLACVFDVAMGVAIAAADVPREPRVIDATRRRARAGFAGGGALVLSLLFLAVVPKHVTLPLDGELDDSTGVVLIEPTAWVGKRCPILRHIDLGNRLANGSWLLVLYHHDCRKCQREMRRLAETHRAKGRGYNVALVELPPFGQLPQSIVEALGGAVRARLEPRRRWFAATPIVVRLIDGVVVEAHGPDNADNGVALRSAARDTRLLAARDLALGVAIAWKKSTQTGRL